MSLFSFQQVEVKHRAYTTKCDTNLFKI